MRNLPTRSASLYPAQAQIIRDIEMILEVGTLLHDRQHQKLHRMAVQPGAHEITVYGLTPTADEKLGQG